MKLDEVEMIEPGRWHSAHLSFTDEGLWRVGAKTRQFNVYSRSSRSLLGYIKWWSGWRQYAFIPLNSVFDPKCMRQIARFCEEATDTHKSRLPNKQRVKDMEKARRERRIKQLALTKQQKSGSMDSVSEEQRPQMLPLLVEGVRDLTPLEIALGTIDV